MQNILITAHSGSDGTPDNSLEFVRYALSTGADTLEIDIRRAADGTLVISHDDAEEGAPTLREVFTLVSTHPAMRVNCDLKPAGLEHDVYALACELGLQKRLIYSGTVDAAVYAGDADLRRDVEVYLNIEEYVPDLYLSYRDVPNFELEAAAIMRKVCLERGIRTVNIHQWLVTRRLIETLRQDGIGISAWTVNNRQELSWFLARGVTNITTRTVRDALAIRGGAELG